MSNSYYGSLHEEDGMYPIVGEFNSPEEAAQAFLAIERLATGDNFWIGWNLQPDKIRFDALSLQDIVDGQADEFWEGTDVPEFRDVEKWCKENNQALKALEDSFNKFFNLGKSGNLLNSQMFTIDETGNCVVSKK